MIHPDWASRLAHGSSNASRTYRARDEGRGLRSYAEQQLESAPDLDLLVYGHSHVAALERMSGGGVFANAGSWLDAEQFTKLCQDREERGAVASFVGVTKQRPATLAVDWP